MTTPLFLLGAGFNKNAKEEAGKIIGQSIHKDTYEIGYPLVDELCEICFPDVEINLPDSIEKLFDDAIKRRDFKPLQKLCDIIMEADLHLIPGLRSDQQNRSNCYVDFFNRFRESSFLTFNYDSLPEAFLLQLGQWYPHDGYGVSVETHLAWNAHGNYTKQNSKSLILHLHGSLCIYTSKFELNSSINDNTQLLEFKDEPGFVFDPGFLSEFFYPYCGGPPKIASYEDIEMRVIAPIPDKAEGIKQDFIKQVHLKAKELLIHSDQLVVIGYNFSAHDKSSYHHLLEYLSNSWNGNILIVSPNAKDIESRLKSEYPKIEWQNVVATFKEWGESGYDGIN